MSSHVQQNFFCLDVYTYVPALWKMRDPFVYVFSQWFMYLHTHTVRVK
jgi:hypothetical protein